MSFHYIPYPVGIAALPTADGGVLYQLYGVVKIDGSCGWSHPHLHRLIVRVVRCRRTYCAAFCAYYGGVNLAVVYYASAFRGGLYRIVVATMPGQLQDAAEFGKTVAIDMVEQHPSLLYQVGQAVAVDVGEIPRRGAVGGGPASAQRHADSKLYPSAGCGAALAQETFQTFYHYRLAESYSIAMVSPRTIIHMVALFVHLVGQPVAVDVYHRDKSLAGRLAIAEVSSQTRRGQAYHRTGSHRGGPTHTPALAFAGAQQGAACQSASYGEVGRDMVVGKAAESPRGSKQAVCRGIVVIVAMVVCGVPFSTIQKWGNMVLAGVSYKHTIRCLVHNIGQTCLVLAGPAVFGDEIVGSFALVGGVGPVFYPYPTQGGGGHLFESVASADDLVYPLVAVAVEDDVETALLVSKTCIVYAAYVYLLARLLVAAGHYVVIVAHLVAIGVLALGKRPIGNIPVVVAEHALVIDLPVAAAVIVGDAVAVGHAPPVVERRVAVAHHAVGTLVNQREELYVAAQPRLGLVGAVGQGPPLSLPVAGGHLLAVFQVYLTFVVAAVSRHAPAGVHRDGGDFYVPAYAQPSVATAVAVGQRQRRLHAVASCGDVYRQAHIGRTHIVGAGRLHQREPSQRLAGLYVAQRGGHIGVGLGHLGGFEYLVDKVGEMAGKAHYLAIDGVHLLAV